MINTFVYIRQEATVPTFIDHLQERLQKYLTRPDVAERMKPLEAACEGALEALMGISYQLGMVIQRVAESPPSPGYEPWLVERGYSPIVARAMARLMVRRGNGVAKEAARLSAAVRAIRFLAKPDCQRRAISRKVDVLLAA